MDSPYTLGLGAGSNVFIGARMSKNANQSFSNGVEALITWQVQNFDTVPGGVVDLANDQFLIPAGINGMYGIVEVWVVWLSDPTASTRRTRLFKNDGTEVRVSQVMDATTATTNGSVHCCNSGPIKFATGDKFYAKGFQDAGNALDMEDLEEITRMTLTVLGS